MIILGLTGSIGMGKTTAASDFRRLGVAVHDADQTVHTLMSSNGAAVAKIGKVFPDVVSRHGVNRQKLGDAVFGDDDALKKLEAILHPLVRQSKTRFLRQMALRRQRLVVLDVPLLFETGSPDDYDGVCVVTAPDFVQRARVLRRPGMTEDKFINILNRQLDDASKRAQADFVIQTGLGRHESWQSIRRIVRMAQNWRPRVWLAGRHVGPQILPTKTN